MSSHSVSYSPDGIEATRRTVRGNADQIRCLVINLDRSKDRLVQVTSEFARIGVAFERIAAVDAAGISKAPRLTGAETACFRSHQLCWRMIADGSQPYGAIFEDDVVFGHDASSLLRSTSWVPKDADVVKLETFLDPVRIDRQRHEVAHGYSVTRLFGRHHGAAAYILSKSAAKKLLRLTKHLRSPVDNALFDPATLTFVRLTVYQMVPAPCIQSQWVSREDKPESLIQQRNLAPKQDTVGEKIHKHAARAILLLRNGTFRGTEKVVIPYRAQE